MSIVAVAKRHRIVFELGLDATVGGEALLRLDGLGCPFVALR